jgi:uncharacterized protein (DUF427 family)
MFQAAWKGTVLAESGHTVKVEGNHYFPPQSLRREFLAPSDTSSTCPWKGTASYYDVTVDGQVNKNAAWYYPRPGPAVAQVAGHVAFCTASRCGGSPAAPARPATAPSAAAAPRTAAGSAGGCGPCSAAETAASRS